MPRHPPRALCSFNHHSIIDTTFVSWHGYLIPQVINSIRLLTFAPAIRRTFRPQELLAAEGSVDCLFGGCAGGAGGTRTPDFRLAKAALSQLSYGPTSELRLVGDGGLEPPTSVLSGPRSNQLS